MAKESTSSTVAERNDRPATIKQIPQELLHNILYLSGPPYRKLRLVCRRWESTILYLTRRLLEELDYAVEHSLQLRWEIVPKTKKDYYRMPYILSRKYFKTSVYHRGLVYVFSEKYIHDKLIKTLFRFDTELKMWIEPVSVRSSEAPKDVSFMFEWDDKILCFPAAHGGLSKLWTSILNVIHLYNTNTNMWSKVRCSGNPGHLKGYEGTLHGDLLVLYGGVQNQEMNSSYLWCLNLLEFKWKKMAVQGNALPGPRHCHLQVAIDENHLLVVGGEGYNENYNDAWLLDMTHKPWIWKEIRAENEIGPIEDFRKTAACKIGDKLLVFQWSPFFNEFSSLLAARSTPSSLDVVTNVGIINQNLYNLRPAVNSMQPPHGEMGFSLTSLYVCDVSGALNSSAPLIHWNCFKDVSLFPGAPTVQRVANMINAEGKIIVFGGYVEGSKLTRRVQILEPIVV